MLLTFCLIFSFLSHSQNSFFLSILITNQVFQNLASSYNLCQSQECISNDHRLLSFFGVDACETIFIKTGSVPDWNYRLLFSNSLKSSHYPFRLPFLYDPYTSHLWRSRELLILLGPFSLVKWKNNSIYIIVLMKSI